MNEPYVACATLFQWSPVGLTDLSQNFMGVKHQNGAFIAIKLPFFYCLK